MTENQTEKLCYDFDFERLRALRKEAGLSMIDLGIRLYQVGATKCPLSRQYISQWETGVNRPNSATLRGLAVVLGVPMESFFKKAGD